MDGLAKNGLWENKASIIRGCSEARCLSRLPLEEYAFSLFNNRRSLQVDGVYHNDVYPSTFVLSTGWVNSNLQQNRPKLFEI